LSSGAHSLCRSISHFGASEGRQLPESIVKRIDHSVLQPVQTDDDVRSACIMCAELGVASVCVKPSHVLLAAECLRGSTVRVGTVIGFPHGGTSTEAKIAETQAACGLGAQEVDMVVNLGKVLSADWPYVERDIRAVVDQARREGAITKVIFETGLLPADETKIRLCQISESAGAAFVKTSTGFGFVKRSDGAMVATGATEHDVRLMREHSGPAVQVKASGGIRSYDDACRFVELGAARLGTSATREIAEGERGLQTQTQEKVY
jgi:deoxyribose-phosphate aldolase